jgi:hypothetical protein
MTKTQTKYEPLKKHLASKGFSEIPMRFSDIESIIKNNLPPSARKHRAWWSNNPSNSVITFAWLNAGYKTAKVDLTEEKLVFVRDNALAKAAADTPHNPVFGCMKGSVTISDDLDLTAPAMPEWGAIAENARLPA